LKGNSCSAGFAIYSESYFGIHDGDIEQDSSGGKQYGGQGRVFGIMPEVCYDNDGARTEIQKFGTDPVMYWQQADAYGEFDL
jgi:hypothetical protein